MNWHSKTVIIGTSLVVSLVILALIILLLRLGRRKKYPGKVQTKWLTIQRLCSKKENWERALVSADKLLGESLKKSGFKGKSIGERLVAAQHKLTDNDAVWYAHNLAKKVQDKSAKKLRQNDVKRALIGIRQALRDLGVLNGK